MKVVILGTRGFPNVQGGVEKHCECLSVGLVRQGCEVVVFTRKPYVNENIKEFKGVKLITLRIFKHKTLEAFLHTFIGVFAALRYKPDILHIQAIGPALFAPLARFLGMKVVVTSHGSDYRRLKWGRFAKLVLRIGEFLGVTFANEIIAISDDIAQEIKEKYNRNATVIYNGVSFLSPIVTSENTLSKYNLKRGRYVLAVGRFVPEKGFHDLICAFDELQLDGWKLTIVGDADHPSKYSFDLKEEAGKNNNIILTGALKEEPLRELYSQAGIFVLPSYYEGLSVVLLEAMGYGLLCLVSDIPANRSVDLPDENYFAAGDIKQITRKLQEFIKKPLSQEQKSSQMKMVREKYSWDDIARKTQIVYRKVAVI